MRAIILSAGQGTRLRPQTLDTPKCLLPVRGSEPVLEVQLRALALCGVTDVVVVAGFQADQVRSFLARKPVPGVRALTYYNPFFKVAEGLVSCWVARTEMRHDFVLLNGNTLFEAAALGRLLASPPAPAAIAVARKAAYDEDDMKVSVDSAGRLVAVGKKLDPATVNGESIGLTLFRGMGPGLFVRALDAALQHPSCLHRGHHSVLDRMARHGWVETTSIEGLRWSQIDSPEELKRARAALEAPPHQSVCAP